MVRADISHTLVYQVAKSTSFLTPIASWCASSILASCFLFDVDVDFAGAVPTGSALRAAKSTTWTFVSAVSRAERYLEISVPWRKTVASDAEARTAKTSGEEEMAESSTMITLENTLALMERGETATDGIDQCLPDEIFLTNSRTRILIQGKELLDEVISCESELLLVDPLAQGR